MNVILVSELTYYTIAVAWHCICSTHAIVTLSWDSQTRLSLAPLTLHSTTRQPLTDIDSPAATARDSIRSSKQPVRQRDLQF